VGGSTPFPILGLIFEEISAKLKILDNIMDYSQISKEIRQDILEMIFQTKSPHIGCSFSIVELLVALYFKVLNVNPQKPDDPNRDRFVLSKGHGCPALYPVLAKRGFFDKKVLEGFATDAGTLETHSSHNVSWGIEASTGSVGHGLSLAAGMALAAKYDKSPSRIFVLLGDGELDEGSNWEAIMFSSHHKLDNLVAIVDRNQCQILGKTSEVLDLEPLADKWRSFGWQIKEVDGHNFEEIFSALEKIPFEEGKPSCLIAHTVKGKGVSFMEGELRWHDKCPNEGEYKKALDELK